VLIRGSALSLKVIHESNTNPKPGIHTNSSRRIGITVKTLGLIGGVGPESTIEYYRLIIAGYRERTQNQSYPSIIINNVNLQRLIDLFAANELQGVADYLVEQIEKLAKAGADFGAITANTPHIVFDEVQKRSKIPLISIVEAACERVKELGIQRVALFGTRYTMQANFYPEVFARAGLNLILPEAEEQSFIHEKYLGELLNNKFLPETRAAFLGIADRLKRDHGVEAIILGGTEIPLLLRDSEYNGIQLLDTMQIHVQRLLQEM
jgi:aspartate racemase